MNKHLLRSCIQALSKVALPAIILALLALQNVSAQIIEEPVVRAVKSVAQPSARTKEDATPLPLPFWDDFSTASQYPDTLWVNSNSVWIQDGTGLSAPTINVATFNGLKSDGTPYNQNEPTAKGFGDELVSRPIILGDTTGGVAPGERNTVILSFFYQWKGGQEPPDQNDFLRVEFLNSSKTWEAIETIFGDQELKADSFYTKTIPITEERFFHNKFQFRLRSFGRLSGPFDSWMVDYVYLNKGRINNDPDDFPDQAISSNLTSLFGPYRSIPLHQFFSANPVSSPSFGLHNLKNLFEPITYRVALEIVSITDDVPVTLNKVLGDSIIIDNGGLSQRENRSVTIPTSNLPDASDPDFDQNADRIELTLTVSAYTGDVEQSNGTPAADYAKYSPLELRMNDTTRNSYILADYLAYDDGTAEYAIRLTTPGNRLACRFDLPSYPDTLVGFEIYCPYFGGSNSQTLDFYVYADNNGVPEQIPLRPLLSRTIQKNGSNQFTLIDMRVEPLLIPDSTFYIGWKEPVSGRVDVGLDKSHDTGDKIYVNTNGTWIQNTEIKGSLMLRPIFGSGTNLPTVGLPEEKNGPAVYPNPNKGVFYVDEILSDIEILDVTGKRIVYQAEPTGKGSRITIPSASSGIYIIRWYENGMMRSRKIIVNPAH